jgi:myo-inositol-1(or 4)-monophosphatase
LGRTGPVTAGPDDPRLTLAARLAREAGRRALDSRGQVQVEWKGPGDRVTDVDIAIQAGIVREIAARFPGDGILAEETPDGVSGDPEFVWVVDPLDGTNNYAVGIPCFSVSIGILRGGRAWGGVIHDPNTGFTCWGAQGGGAFADGHALALAGRPLTIASNVAVRVPLDARLRPLVHQWLERFKFRGFGSVALQLGYAAIGGLDILLDHRASLWDIAAGAAILLEAGGTITDLTGGSLFPVAPEAWRGPLPFLAGNPLAHGQALAACKPLVEDVGPPP